MENDKKENGQYLLWCSCFNVKKDRHGKALQLAFETKEDTWRHEWIALWFVLNDKNSVHKIEKV